MVMAVKKLGDRRMVLAEIRAIKRMDGEEPNPFPTDCRIFKLPIDQKECFTL
jgi:hypothetical protein